MTPSLRSIALAFLVALSAPAQAQDQDGAAIQGVISGQIDAFRADDFATAFTFASPDIRSMFGTAENFGAMVRGGYPMVWRPDQVTFGDIEERDGVLHQRVVVRDAAGRLHVLDYQMEEGPDGWRIDGVQLLPAPEVNA